MNKKGFTLVEILAVIIILGILATIATTSVTRYRQLVREKEAVHLHAEIESTYDNLKISGSVAESGVVRFCKRGDDRKQHIIMSIAYDGKRLGCSGDSNAEIRVKNGTKANNYTDGSYFISKNKGDLLNNTSYLAAIGNLTGDALEKQLVNDGICMVTSTENRTKLNEEGTETQSTLVRSCVKENDNIKPSTNSILCIKLLRNDGSVIINDFDGNNAKNESFCKYFGE